MKSINIVIPMKDPSQSKQRLRSVLAAGERESLALSLFEQTLVFFRTHFPEFPVLVVTGSDLIEGMAQQLGASVLKEEHTGGLSESISLAAQWGREQGFQSQLFIPADIARLDVQEISTLLQQSRPDPSVIICPADDEGTNALLTTPPDVIPFRFGRRSSRVHQAEALLKRVSCQMVHLAHLTFDIDTPEDLFDFTAGQGFWAQEVTG